MKQFRSELGGIIVLPIVISIAVSIMIGIQFSQWGALAVNAAVCAFVIHMFVTTRYTINGSILHITCGFFSSTTIDINTIVRIAKTNNPVSAPAFSLNRLEIRDASGETVLISPKGQSEFLQHISTLNSKIRIER